MSRKASRFIVQGRVQGVGYRYFALHAAIEMGISGYVRNNDDGTVEAWGEGTEAALVAFANALRLGPVSARVEDVFTEPVAPRGSRSFEVR